MEYTKQLIEKAKHSRCQICREHIIDSEAEGQEFQATKTSRGGGTASYTPDAGRVRRKEEGTNGKTKKRQPA